MSWRSQQIFLLFAASLVLTFPQLSFADSSASFDVDLSTINPSGSLNSSSTFQLNDTFSLINGDNSTSDNYTLHNGLVQLELYCGNGILEFGEACDDGNAVSNDGCSSVCQIDAPITPPDQGSGGDSGGSGGGGGGGSGFIGLVESEPDPDSPMPISPPDITPDASTQVEPDSDTQPEPSTSSGLDVEPDSSTPSPPSPEQNLDEGGIPTELEPVSAPDSIKLHVPGLIPDSGSYDMPDIPDGAQQGLHGTPFGPEASCSALATQATVCFQAKQTYGEYILSLLLLLLLSLLMNAHQKHIIRDLKEEKNSQKRQKKSRKKRK